MAGNSTADTGCSVWERVWVGLEGVFKGQPTGARNQGMMEGGVLMLPAKQTTAALDITQCKLDPG